MSAAMPPEPPPPTGESDYAGGSGRRSGPVVTIPISEGSTFGVDDIPVPTFLQSLEPTPELNSAWANLLGEENDPIPKRGHNKFFNYDYATADDIRARVGSVLGKHGLHYEQHIAGFAPWGILIRVTYYFIIRHSSGQSSPPIRHDELVRTTSERGAPDDKALGKAGVLALKNFSKVHFSVDTGDIMDDPDGDGPVVDAHPAHANRSPAPARASGNGARQAFRNAGLPPKVESPPSANAHGDETPHDPETGEILDAWTVGTLAALNAEEPGPRWLDLLKSAFENSPTFAAFQNIDRAPSVTSLVKEASPQTQTKVRAWRHAAQTRLARGTFPDDVSDESDVSRTNA